MEFKHIPVMLEPCMELLGLDRHPDGVFVDGTLGGGGHTQEILSRTRGKVLGIDRDWEALRAAGERLRPLATALFRFTEIMRTSLRFCTKRAMIRWTAC